MTCQNCSQEVSENATFCGYCGSQISTNQQSPIASTTNITNPQLNTIAQSPRSTQPIIPTPISISDQSSIASPTTPTQQIVEPVIAQAATNIVAPQVMQPDQTPTNDISNSNQPNPISQVMYHNNTSAAPVAPMNMQTTPAGAGGMTTSTIYPNPTIFRQNINPTNHQNGFAIAAFVISALGLIGWIIPIVGLPLGIIAIVFASISIHSRKRVFAIVGMILATITILLSIGNWVYAANKFLSEQNTNKTYTNQQSNNTSFSTKPINSPCYTANIPEGLTISQATGSCTFQATNQTTGELYVVKNLSVDNLSVTNLDYYAKKDIKSIVDLLPGSSISSQYSTKFSKSPAYEFKLAGTAGEAATIDYIFKTTPNGNMTIVMHSQNSSSADHNLNNIQSNWVWK